MSIRTVDPTCRICRRPLQDDLARRRRIGPDCWARLTPAEQRRALELAAQERDPHHIPAERAPSAQTRINNHNARATITPGTVQLCHHDAQIGRCGDCRREADPWRAAELIVRHVTAQPLQQRRAERIEILRARYATVTLWTAPPNPRPKPRPEPAPKPAPPGPQQLELL